MSTPEREVIEKFYQLDKDAQARVRALIAHSEGMSDQPGQKPFDYESWLAQIEAARITLRPDASGRVPSASDLVNDVREERDADILRGSGFGNSAGDGI